MELFDRRGVAIRHAEDIRFDNATSGLAATNVQAAIDELPANAFHWSAVHTFDLTPVVPNDSWTYAKLQNVSATSRFLGRITAGSGDVEELTGTQATTLLNLFSSVLQGLVPASGGGTANFLRADGTFAAPAGGITGLANPTSPGVDLVGANGTALTAMRSDAKLVLDQSIVPTWSGTHTFSNVPVVPNDSWTYAKIQNATALSLLGRASNSSGDLADIAAGSDGQVLLRNGSALAFTAPTAPAAGLTISTGLTFALANDLSALEGLASAGFAARTATDTWAIRTLQPPAAGITITNPAGTAGDPTLVLANDLAALEGLGSTGFAARTTTDTWAQRTLTAPAAGFTITNPAGISGDPTFVLANDLSALEGLGTTGIAVRTATDTWTTRTLTEVANRTTVTNGTGVSGNPTVDISATYVGQASITTLGTITTGTWTGTTIAPANGGTGATAVPTNGQLLIGNGTTYTVASLTAPATGVSITGGSGSITFALTNDLSALEGLASTGFAARTATDTWAQRTLTAPAAGFTITNPAGIAGNPTFVLANDLSALEGLNSTGIAVRTTTDTWAQRTITEVSNRTTVTNGDGVSGNPTVDISATYVGQASITTLGTVTTGTWSATAIVNAKLAQMAAFTLKGNNTNSTASPVDLTSAQVKAMPFYTNAAEYSLAGGF